MSTNSWLIFFSLTWKNWNWKKTEIKIKIYINILKKKYIKKITKTN